MKRYWKNILILMLGPFIVLGAIALGIICLLGKPFGWEWNDYPDCKRVKK